MSQIIIGSRVKGGPGLRSPFCNQIGTVLSGDDYYVSVQFDRVLEGKREWHVSKNDVGYGITLILITPEEDAKHQDEQKRLEWAMQYL